MIRRIEPERAERPSRSVGIAPAELAERVRFTTALPLSAGQLARWLVEERYAEWRDGGVLVPTEKTLAIGWP